MCSPRPPGRGEALAPPFTDEGTEAQGVTTLVKATEGTSSKKGIQTWSICLLFFLLHLAGSGTHSDPIRFQMEPKFYP